MLIGPDDTAVGSVSVGCVEGAVYGWAARFATANTPWCSATAISDDDASSVGLTCGGIIDLFIERINQETFPKLAVLAPSIDADNAVALATVVAGHPHQLGRHLLVWH